MARTPKIVGPRPIDLTPETVYTVPAGATGVLRHVHVYNGEGSAGAFTLTANDDVAGSAIFQDKSVDADSPFDHYCFYPFPTGTNIRASAGNDDLLTLTIGIDEIT